MSKIFISWSKEKSRDLAIEIKSLLESLDPHSKVFMSENDISAGEPVQKKIIQEITECDILLLCFTKENKKSPWLLYEAGFANGLNKRIIPFLFDVDPNWHSWIDNPMNFAREINVTESDFTEKFIQGFDLHDSSYVRNILDNFIKRTEEIKEKHRQIDVQCEEFVELLTSNDAFRAESPIYRNRTAFFLTGFETFDLWKSVVQSFLYTGKYLWIYGKRSIGGTLVDLPIFLDN